MLVVLRWRSLLPSVPRYVRQYSMYIVLLCGGGQFNWVNECGGRWIMIDTDLLLDNGMVVFAGGFDNDWLGQDITSWIIQLRTHNLISHLPLQFSGYIPTFYFAGFELGETFCNTHSIGAVLIIVNVSLLYWEGLLLEGGQYYCIYPMIYLPSIIGVYITLL